MNNKKYVIEAKNELPFAVQNANGYEFWSNDRKLHIVIEKRTAFNPFNNTQQVVYTTSCWILYANGWERGDNSVNVYSINDYVNELNISPYFTKAVSEYRHKNNITEV